MTTNTPTDPLVEALKTCPFCGTAPSEYIRQDESLFSHAIVDYLTITCTECDGASMHSEDHAEIREKWNTRALYTNSSRVTPPVEAVEPDWPISTDGPVKINDQRRWLARQLMDSKLSDKEAMGIVAHHPGIGDLHPATPPAEAVAWRVKDYAGGWILFPTKPQARREARGTDRAVQPLYATPPAPEEGVKSSYDYECLLLGRDNFIVRKGLWGEFVDQADAALKSPAPDLEEVRAALKQPINNLIAEMSSWADPSPGERDAAERTINAVLTSLQPKQEQR